MKRTVLRSGDSTRAATLFRATRRAVRMRRRFRGLSRGSRSARVRAQIRSSVSGGVGGRLVVGGGGNGVLPGLVCDDMEGDRAAEQVGEGALELALGPGFDELDAGVAGGAHDRDL